MSLWRSWMCRRLKDFFNDFFFKRKWNEGYKRHVARNIYLTGPCAGVGSGPPSKIPEADDWGACSFLEAFQFSTSSGEVLWRAPLISTTLGANLSSLPSWFTAEKTLDLMGSFYLNLITWGPTWFVFVWHLICKWPVFDIQMSAAGWWRSKLDRNETEFTLNGHHSGQSSVTIK